MRSFLFMLTTLLPLHAQAYGQTVSPEIAAAVSDIVRPATDRQRDADRKPAEVLIFAEVKSGQKVVDLLPGGGYFTRLLAKAVGPNGKVYAYLDEPNEKFQAVAAAYPNVVVIVGKLNEFKIPEPVDLVMTSSNYHDLKNADMETDTAVFNKAVFSALKPGGIFFISDNAAEPGSGARDTNTLHRIDPAFVKNEVLAAGFKFDGESQILSNTEDPHKVRSRELGDTVDIFVLKFRNPKAAVSN